MKIIILSFYFTILFIFQISSSAYSQQSKFNTSGPNAKVLGEDKNFTYCKNYSDHWSKPDCRIGNFSEMDRVLNNYRLTTTSKDKINLKFYQNPPEGLIKKIDDYISKHSVVGFLILKNGEIVIERYQYGRKKDMTFRIFSMSKTFTAMLTGIAMEKGLIKLEDKVSNYWPEIKDSVYGNITVKELLLMSSGVEGGEYSTTPGPNWPQMWTELFKRENLSQPNKFNDYLNGIKSYGRKGNFRYSDLDTEVLSRVLVKATKKNIATLTSEWLWQPIDAEITAEWIYATTDSIEQGSSGFHASLNDLGKFGVLLANDGKYKNKQIIPYNFLLEATDVNKIPKTHVAVNYFNAFQYGYGYQTWLQPNKDRTFCALGHYGQIICVQPSSKIVMVQTAVEGHDAWKNSFGNMGGSLTSIWKEILKDLGGSND
jgi:CubicO group peptidase (beta-lactamase class C family)